MDSSTLDQWILPLALALAGLVTGLIFKRIILPRLRKCCALAHKEWLEVIAAASSHFITLWFALMGFYLFVLLAPFKPTLGSILEEALFVFAAGSVIIFIAKSLAGLFELYSKGQEGILRTTSMFKHLIYVIVGIFGTLFIFQSLGFSITPLLAALGVGGIAVALAIQNPLSNFFSGLHIIASSEIRPGDYIKLDTGDEGMVMDISWHSTSLRAPTNYFILVPNSKLSSAIVTNYQLDISDMVFAVNGIVGYESNLEQFQRIALDAANDVIENVAGSVREFEAVFLYTGLNDSGVDFSVFLKGTSFGKQAEMKHEFIKRLDQHYRDEKTPFPYPRLNISSK